MPIVINRHTGEVISRPEITQQQRNKLWEFYLNKWMDKHPDKLLELFSDQNVEEVPMNEE